MKKDLATGKIGEEKLISAFNVAGLKSSPNKDVALRSLYDIITTSNKSIRDTTGLDVFYTEVKYDLYAMKSGNIAIEIWNPKSNKPSGLTISESHLWCQITDKIYLASTNELKLYVENTTPCKFIPRAGDGNASLNLYKADKLLPAVFTEISNLPKKELIALIIKLLCG